MRSHEPFFFLPDRDSTPGRIQLCVYDECIGREGIKPSPCMLTGTSVRGGVYPPPRPRYLPTGRSRVILNAPRYKIPAAVATAPGHSFPSFRRQLVESLASPLPAAYSGPLPTDARLFLPEESGMSFVVEARTITLSCGEESTRRFVVELTRCLCAEMTRRPARRLGRGLAG